MSTYWNKISLAKSKAKKSKKIDSIGIGLASPEEIRRWGERRLPNGTIIGKVDKDHTVDYESLKPIQGGLFCERIFGPVEDFYCSCERRGEKNEKFCPNCEVEFTKSRVRRIRMGYIPLAVPVVHVWYLRGRPSYIANLIGKSRNAVDKLAYGETLSESFIGNFNKSFSRAQPVRVQEDILTSSVLQQRGNVKSINSCAKRSFATDNESVFNNYNNVQSSIAKQSFAKNLLSTESIELIKLKQSCLNSRSTPTTSFLAPGINQAISLSTSERVSPIQSAAFQLITHPSSLISLYRIAKRRSPTTNEHGSLCFAPLIAKRRTLSSITDRLRLSNRLKTTKNSDSFISLVANKSSNSVDTSYAKLSFTTNSSIRKNIYFFHQNKIKTTCFSRTKHFPELSNLVNGKMKIALHHFFFRKIEKEHEIWYQFKNIFYKVSIFNKQLFQKNWLLFLDKIGVVSPFFQNFNQTKKSIDPINFSTLATLPLTSGRDSLVTSLIIAKRNSLLRSATWSITSECGSLSTPVQSEVLQPITENLATLSTSSIINPSQSKALRPLLPCFFTKQRFVEPINQVDNSINSFAKLCFATDDSEVSKSTLLYSVGNANNSFFKGLSEKIHASIKICVQKNQGTIDGVDTMPRSLVINQVAERRRLTRFSISNQVVRLPRPLVDNEVDKVEKLVTGAINKVDRLKTKKNIFGRNNCDSLKQIVVASIPARLKRKHQNVPVIRKQDVWIPTYLNSTFKEKAINFHHFVLGTDKKSINFVDNSIDFVDTKSSNFVTTPVIIDVPEKRSSAKRVLDSETSEQGVISSETSEQKLEIINQVDGVNKILQTFTEETKHSKNRIPPSLPSKKVLKKYNKFHTLPLLSNFVYKEWSHRFSFLEYFIWSAQNDDLALSFYSYQNHTSTIRRSVINEVDRVTNKVGRFIIDQAGRNCQTYRKNSVNLVKNIFYFYTNTSQIAKNKTGSSWKHFPSTLSTSSIINPLQSFALQPMTTKCGSPKTNKIVFEAPNLLQLRNKGGSKEVDIKKFSNSPTLRYFVSNLIANSVDSADNKSSNSIDFVDSKSFAKQSFATATSFTKQSFVTNIPTLRTDNSEAWKSFSKFPTYSTSKEDWVRGKNIATPSQSKALRPLPQLSELPFRTPYSSSLQSQALQKEDNQLINNAYGIQEKAQNNSFQKWEILSRAKQKKSPDSIFDTIDTQQFPRLAELLHFTGGTALRHLLSRFDLILLGKFLRHELKNLELKVNSLLALKILTYSQGLLLGKLAKRRSKQIRRLKLLELFQSQKSNPEWMILSVLPVLPPDLRPILRVNDDFVVASDLNRLYQTVLRRNNTIHERLDDPLPCPESGLFRQRSLQKAVDGLLENGKGGGTPLCASKRRPLVSLSHVLKGKKGLFRQHLLGKRVDYSGRSVIVVGPKLHLHECGLPKEMAMELFQPFLLHRLKIKGLATSNTIARRMIQQEDPVIWQILKQLVYEHPVLLNRAPTLHRLGIQAFQPRLVSGRAILLHPLVCNGFNADFDGDQMAVHVPLSFQARAEAWKIMWSKNNLLSPATGQPILVPSQDMVLGCYYLSVSVPRVLSFLTPTISTVDKNKTVSFISNKSHSIDCTNSIDSVDSALQSKDSVLLRNNNKSTNFLNNSIIKRGFAPKFYGTSETSESTPPYSILYKSKICTNDKKFIDFVDNKSNNSFAKQSFATATSYEKVNIYLNKNKGHYFSNLQDSLLAYFQGRLQTHTPFWVRIDPIISCVENKSIHISTLLPQEELSMKLIGSSCVVSKLSNAYIKDVKKNITSSLQNLSLSTWSMLHPDVALSDSKGLAVMQSEDLQKTEQGSVDSDASLSSVVKQSFDSEASELIELSKIQKKETLASSGGTYPYHVLAKKQTFLQPRYGSSQKMCKILFHAHYSQTQIIIEGNETLEAPLELRLSTNGDLTRILTTSQNHYHDSATFVDQCKENCVKYMRTTAGRVVLNKAIF